MATLTPPDISNISSIDILDIGSIVSWWDQATYGAFSIIVPLVLVASVYLKTKSLIATSTALILVTPLLMMRGFTSIISLIVGLILTFVFFSIWKR